MSAPRHVGVLISEVLAGLNPQPGGVFVDGTLGGGGHATAIAQRIGPNGRVVALDRDPAALEAAQTNLVGLPIEVVHANFCDLPELLAEKNIAAVDGILLDLGLSSDQLADVERGFSFASDGPLDLRFDPLSGEPASRLVNRLSAEHLADLIFHFGEERFSRRIARAIVEKRHHESDRNLGATGRNREARNSRGSATTTNRSRHTHFSSIANCREQRIEITRYRIAAFARLPKAGGTTGDNQLSFVGRSPRQGSVPQ